MNTQNTAAAVAVSNATEVARLAAEQAAKLATSAACVLAKKVINADIRSAKNVSRGVFDVIRACSSWAEAKSAFEVAENQLMEEKKVKTLSALAQETGVKQLSYVSIKNSMLADINSDEKLRSDLTDLYQFQYNAKTREEQAQDALETVPDGFLNIWSRRYNDTDDESGATRFNRDRKLAKDSLAQLQTLKKIQEKARKQEEANAKERLAESMRRASGATDNAPAGSGQTAQGIAGSTAGQVARQNGRTLSHVVTTALGLFTNAVWAASDCLADSEILPLMGDATDKILALVEVERSKERQRTAELSREHNRPVAFAENDNDDQTSLEDGDMSALPDLEPEEELTDTDRALIEEIHSQDGPSAAEDVG